MEVTPDTENVDLMAPVSPMSSESEYIDEIVELAPIQDKEKNAPEKCTGKMFLTNS